MFMDFLYKIYFRYYIVFLNIFSLVYVYPTLENLISDEK